MLCDVMGDSGGKRFCWRLYALSFRCRLLTCCPGESSYSSAVDIFDVSSGQWRTAALSVARSGLAATSLPNEGLAIFAGGGVVDIFDVSSGQWRTAALSMARSGLAATSLPNEGLAIFAGGQTAHIFNVSSGQWRTAALSRVRSSLAATSLPNEGLAIFAGGNDNAGL